MHLVLFIFFIRTHTAYWADCFLELHPPLIRVYDMCDFYIIDDLQR